MLTVCPYFHVHQPHRIKKYRAFDIGNDSEYFNDAGDSDLNNEKVITRWPRSRTCQPIKF